VDEDTILYYHIGARTPEDSKKALAALKEHGLKTQERTMSGSDILQLMRMM
jgi:hypothetical protein